MSSILTYAIGDIHGRLDLLKNLLEKIKDHAKGEDYRLVFLGDYVDRGSSSRQVIDHLIDLKRQEWKYSPVFLMGNHEDQMNTVLSKRIDWEYFSKWLFHGGTNTLESYDVDLLYGEENGFALRRSFQEKVSHPHRSFLRSLKLCFQTADFFYCHAGVNLNTPLGEQSRHDLLWIRGEFTKSSLPAEKMIIHGHSVTENYKPEVRANRVGVDTGAYKSENLTACVVKGNEVCGFVMTLE